MKPHVALKPSTALTSGVPNNLIASNHWHLCSAIIESQMLLGSVRHGLSLHSVSAAILTSVSGNRKLLPSSLDFLERLFCTDQPLAAFNVSASAFARHNHSRSEASLRDLAVQWTRSPASSPPHSLEDTSASSEAHAQQESLVLNDAEQLRERKPPRFVDRLRVTAQAGRGGNGCISFWRSQSKGKFRPPDGGNGGNGGDVVLSASSRIKSLGGLNHLHRASAGKSGGKQKLAGARGKDCIIQVPVGTVVYVPQQQHNAELEVAVPDWILRPNEPWIGARDYTSDEDSSGDSGVAGPSSEVVLKQRLGREVADLSEEGQRHVLARGGQGGNGNAYNSSQQRSRSGEAASVAGCPGERTDAHLEVRVLADIGLVGAPNAGKSSLLRALTAASPKVAPYPFTTLQPHLGSLQYEAELSLTIADIPGLIPGAAYNRGLGHSFLRHISRAKALIFVLDISSGLAENKEGPRPWEQLALLQEELRLYNESLTSKPAVIVANKMDKLAKPESTLAALRRRTQLPVLPTSATQGAHGIGKLRQEVLRLATAAAAK